MAETEPVSEVYIRKDALAEAIEQAKKAVPDETIGFMLGKVREWEKRTYVVIERLVTAETDSTKTTTKFKTEALGKVAGEIRDDEVIIGWYHSHPSYGCFMSREDLGTQARYQKLWNKAVALVIDPFQIDGKSVGFEIYRANFKTKKWYSVPFDIKGHLDIRMLPEILDFMNPIIEGKPAYLEYDE